MEVLSENQHIRDVNFLHTAYYPTELMLYFEKHHIFEILFDLMILLDRKRPGDVCEFMAKQLLEISKKYDCVNLSVRIHPSPNYENFIRISSKILKAPIIQVKRPISKRCLRKLPDELKRFRLNKKNLIFIDSTNFSEASQSNTENVLSKVFCVNRCLTVDINNHHSEGSAKFDPLETMFSTAQNLNDKVKLLQCSPLHATIKYVERIALIGRPGSGKHWLARMLADRLDVLLVSVKELITRARTDSKCFKKSLEIGLEDNVHTSELITTIVEKRLLEPDCLQFGWILVDFPNTAEDVENLFQLMVAPRKVLFLHANEQLCWKRKVRKLKTPNGITFVHPSDSEIILKTEFDYFNMHKQSIVDALKDRNCVFLDINANQSKEHVLKEISEKLLLF
ncbi:uncharacterized protein LOC129723732 isoform X2 [Wyeomyia smithii]|uniref:uncharacterized protein LOC129723732 isoform X2 n=1 Tax=Wyeomyia smithii TaxID=174621 RepID=UPI002467C5EC|nr:uncharacterized protein LOC129723732 isoform X2 [Wyeomyia smithii]